MADVLVFAVVNLVCIAQAIGFFSRPHNPDRNRGLGVLLLSMAVPAAAAAVLSVRAGRSWWWMAPASFVAFAVFALVGIGFRRPPERLIVVPYLMLFHGSILGWDCGCSPSPGSCGPSPARQRRC